MNVILGGENRIMISPETEFETQWLRRFIPVGVDVQAKIWIKTGTTASEVEGLIVEHD